MLRRLRDSGRSIIFISHFLDDILRISDTGHRSSATASKVATDAGRGYRQGHGHRADDRRRPSGARGELHRRDQARYPVDAPVVLETEGLTLRPRLSATSRSKVRAGEVLGIYGFMGCGQIELARALFGKLAADHGAIKLDGKPIRLSRTPRRHAVAGIAYVPESRRAMLFASRAGLQEHVDQHPRADLEHVSEAVVASGRSPRRTSRRLHIRPPRSDRLLGNLSGGNQQKVALAKWLTHPPKVLVLSEPTRGMDVGAKDDVVRIVRGLRDRGHRRHRGFDRAGDGAVACRPHPGHEARARSRASLPARRSARTGCSQRHEDGGR